MYFHFCTGSDIPTYTTERNNTTPDDYDHVVFTWNSSNNNTLERSKISKTASVSDTGEAGMPDENNEAGLVHREHFGQIVLWYVLTVITVCFAKKSVTAKRQNVIKLLDVQKKIMMVNNPCWNKSKCVYDKKEHINVININHLSPPCV
uniref:Uncharacterized protein n=1 Tax=Magallana gigas TaxID=29159 RepID=K1QVC9_MAGGI